MTRTRHLDDEALITIAKATQRGLKVHPMSSRAPSVRTTSRSGAGSPIWPE